MSPLRDFDFNSFFVVFIYNTKGILLVSFGCESHGMGKPQLVSTVSVADWYAVAVRTIFILISTGSCLFSLVEMH